MIELTMIKTKIMHYLDCCCLNYITRRKNGSTNENIELTDVKRSTLNYSFDRECENINYNFHPVVSQKDYVSERPKTSSEVFENYINDRSNETGVDETGVDEIEVDETEVDETENNSVLIHEDKINDLSVFIEMEYDNNVDHAINGHMIKDFLNSDPSSKEYISSIDILKKFYQDRLNDDTGSFDTEDKLDDTGSFDTEDYEHVDNCEDNVIVFD